MKPPRLLLITLLTGLLLAASATAALAKSPSGGYVSAGQSAGAQYTEDVPTAGGNTPAQAVHTTHRPSVISSSTLSQLRRTPAGAAAAGLADALAPRATTHIAARSRPHRSRPHRGHRHHQRRPRGSTAPPVAGSAAIEAAQTVPGGSGGPDTLFILVLAAILVLISAAGVLRLRRRS